jgi:5-methylcytosine-specific restriction protein B
VAVVDAQQELDRLLEEVPDLSATSTTKFRAVEEFLGELAGLDPADIYATYVSKPGNAKVRFEQSGADDRARLGVAILKEFADMDRTVPPVAALVRPGGMGAAAFVAKKPEAGWSLIKFVETEGGPLADRLQQHFPEVDVETQDATSSAVDRLGSRIDEWKRATGYPTEKDTEQIDARAELADAISADNLDRALQDPAAFDLATFRRLTRGVYGGAGNQAAINTFLQDGEPAIAKLAATIRHLLYGPGDDVERMNAVLTDPELRVHGFSEGLATKCLSVVYPERWVPLYLYRGTRGKSSVIALPDVPLDPLDEAGKSAAELAVESNNALHDLLEPYLPGDPWGQMVFLWWLLTRTSGKVAGVGTARGLDELAEDLLLPTTWLQTMLDLLDDKPQVIFYGPPGTGKTFVARALATFLAPNPEHRVTVQFHPSYSYEDFVEGYRPKQMDEGAVGYEIAPGPLRQLADHAAGTAERCVLLVDEINRGPISKIFGELYYLLEYRDDEVRLQYSSEAFQMPENLIIIGTMNTSDRSIAVLDAALRRRFHFFEFAPDRWPIDAVLRRWLREQGPKEMEWVADLVTFANTRLPDRHLRIGPSHFIRPGLDPVLLDRIWTHTVMPYIEEQFFDEPDLAAEFELERLRTEMAGGAELPDDEGGERDGGEPDSEADPPEGVETDGA